MNQNKNAMQKNVLIVLIAASAIFTGCQLLYPPGVYEDVVQGQGRGRIYVSVNKGQDNASGTSMDKPMKSLSSAIYTAKNNNIKVIYVAGGTYTASNGLNPSGFGASIDVNGLMIFGGFDETFTNRTGKTILDGTNVLAHLLVISNANNIVLDGLVIKNGNASDNGGGMLISNANNITLMNVVFLSNYSVQSGGGIAIENSSTISISGNYISNAAGANGGAAYVFNSTNISFSGNIISNSVGFGFNGGGIYIDSCNSVTIKNCIFDADASGSSGSAIFFNSASTSYGNMVMNSIFTNCSSPTPDTIISFYGAFSNLSIAGNQFSGNGGTYALYENVVPAISYDSFADNVFFSSLGYIYYSYNYSTSYFLSDINTFNTPFIPPLNCPNAYKNTIE